MPTSYDNLIESAHKLPLSVTLSKILRLAESGRDRDFASWIKLELLGYTDSNPVMTAATIVPEYRTVSGEWFDAYNRRLPLKDPNLGFINETRIRCGVVELETFVGATDIIAIQQPDLSDIIRRELHIDVTTFRFSPKSIPQILANIKSQMLERLATRPSLVRSHSENLEAGELPINSSSVPQEKAAQIFNYFITGNVQNLASGNRNVQQKAQSRAGVDNEIFTHLLDAITSSAADKEVIARLTSTVELMRASHGSPSFKAYYQQFMSILADHIQIFGPVVAPYLPGLVTFLR